MSLTCGVTTGEWALPARYGREQSNFVGRAYRDITIGALAINPNPTQRYERFELRPVLDNGTIEDFTDSRSLEGRLPGASSHPNRGE